MAKMCLPPPPQNYWLLLQKLADEVGYECYMQPDQTLYFGPEQDAGTITVNYGAPAGSGAENPGWGLTVDYNPRNNSDINISVVSYDPQTGQK